MTFIRIKVLLATSLAILSLVLAPAKAFAAIQSLNGLTGQNQTFQNDMNVTIFSANHVHSLGWQGLLGLARGGTGASSFLAGSLIFSDGTKLTQDSSNLFWDNANKRLGIGTSSPTTTLDVSGAAKVTSLTTTSDSIINGLDIGLGGGSVSSNTAVGAYALLGANTSSYRNTAVGVRALSNAGSTNDSTALGYYALINNTGESNTALGSGALNENIGGTFNVAVGAGTMDANEQGGWNTALGTDAFFNLNDPNANNNIAIGFNSARYQSNSSSLLVSPRNSIYIGSQTKGYDNNDSNSIVLGSNAIGAGVNTTVIGDSNMGNVYFGSSNANANTHALTIYSGSSTVAGCIVMGDVNGGVQYITLVSGVLTTSSTKPNACQ